MYGQGNYGPQFRHGHPAPPPSFRQAPPPPFQQAPSAGLPPPTVSHGQLHPPPPPPTPGPQPPMGQTYLQPPPPAYLSTPMVHPYQQQTQHAPSYSTPMAHQTSHYAPSSVPLRPRGLTPPPPPAQGHVSYRTHPPPPPPPPPGIQHVPAPPPPVPSTSISITASDFGSFIHGATNNAYPPSLPPPLPPPPPSSPPPLPSSPPPSSSTMEDAPSRDSEALSSDHVDDKSHAAGHVTHRDSVGPTELIGDLSVDDGSQPTKPAEEVIQKIEALCKHMLEVGSHFENLARKNEAGNPQFSFLFGGDPGSADAIGYEYFQWAKKKYNLEASHDSLEKSVPFSRPLESESTSYSLMDVGPATSPADSDMDMEDDVSHPTGNLDFEGLSKEQNREATSVKGDFYIENEQLHDSNETSKQLPPQVSVPRTECHSGLAFFTGKGRDDADSSFTEAPSPVASPQATKSTIVRHVQEPMRPVIENVIPGRIAANRNEVPRMFVDDGSPFRLIQSYASDDSEEDDKREVATGVSPGRVSPTAAVGSSGLHESKRFDLYTSMGSKNVSGIETDSTLSSKTTPVPPSGKGDADSVGRSHMHKESSTIAISPFYVDNLPYKRRRGDQTLNDGVIEDKFGANRQVGRLGPERNGRQDTLVMKVDEFGRMLREGASASDSDSDGMQNNERQRKRGRSWSRSQSPHETRWRRKSRSPWRRKDKRSRSRSWSPRRQRSTSKSPPAFRRMGDFPRRDREQPPECFNFLRGRCIRGASCRFLHHDSGWRKNRHQQYQEISHDSRDHERSDGINVAKETEIAKYDDAMPGERKSQYLQAAPKLDSEDGIYDGRIILDSVSDEIKPFGPGEVGKPPGSVEVNQSQGSQEVIAQIQESQEVHQVQDVSSADLVKEDGTQQPLENRCSLPDDQLQTQASPVDEIQDLPSATQRSQTLSGENRLNQPSQDTIPLPFSEYKNDASQYSHVEGLSVSQPLPQTVQSSLQSQALPAQPYPEQIPVTQALLNPSSVSQQFPNQVPAFQFPSQHLASEEIHPSSISAGGLQLQPSQPPPPLSQGHPIPQFPPYASQPLREYSIHQSASNFQLQPPNINRFPSHVPPLASNYLSLNPPPPKLATNNLPPPPSYFYGTPPRPAIPNSSSGPSQFQQVSMPSRIEFSSQPATRHYPLQEPSHGPAVDFNRQSYSSVAEPRSLLLDEFNRRPEPMGNQHGQLYGGPSFIREEPLSHPSEGLQFQRDDGVNHLPANRDDASVSFPGQPFASSGMHPQPLSFPTVPFAKKTASSHWDSLPLRSSPSEEFHTTSARSMHQQSSHGLRHPINGNFSSDLGGPSNVESSFRRYPPVFPENHYPQSHLPEFGLSKISTASHYNPFASTFEQTPSTSKFVPNVYGRKKDPSVGTYVSSISSGYASVAGLESRTIVEPRRTGGTFLAGPGGLVSGTPSGDLTDHTYPQEPSVGVLSGDQYDPLFDSIEPSSSMLKKFNKVQEQDPLVHDIQMHMPSDVEENNKKKVSSTLANKLETEEFGETATDAEVGAVENGSPLLGDGNDWSPGIPIDLMNPAAGEIEMDQIPSPGKSKKSKDSRSMKLFKVALADFVKEVLKPSWRQGNMSKEAFKTIVKKTVDKVSGAVPSRHVPKTQAKINQYVESSQRKLTKLVMGYVDKYVKM